MRSVLSGQEQSSSVSLHLVSGKKSEVQLVAFRFKRASCVVVGTFNMYIVQPPWLAKIGILPKCTKYALYAKFDEPGNRFVLEGIPSRWTVTPSRIDVETDVETEDCGAKVAAVLAKLPETPLKAIGNNFIYEASLGELETLKDVVCFHPSAPEGYSVCKRSFHVAVKHEEQHFNLQLSVTAEFLELSVNVHTDLTGKDTEYAQNIARQFPHHRVQGELLAEAVLKAKVEHGIANE